tara:strand:- start:172 stop:384 length:213 start_codon:yes stop_codon:yes gene_type:complete
MDVDGEIILEKLVKHVHLLLSVNLVVVMGEDVVVLTIVSVLEIKHALIINVRIKEVTNKVVGEVVNVKEV